MVCEFIQSTCRGWFSFTSPFHALNELPWKKSFSIIMANSHWYKSAHESSENDWFPHIAMVLKTQKVWNEKLNVLLTVQFRIMSIDHMVFFQTLRLRNQIRSKWRVSIVWNIYCAISPSSNSSLNCWGRWAKEAAPLNVSPIIHTQRAGKQPFPQAGNEWM